MKKYLAVSLLSTMFLGGAQSLAATYPTGNSAIQNGIVDLTVDLTGGLVVDPGGEGGNGDGNPGEVIEPTDPLNPPDTNDNEGLLKINYVSDLIFSDNNDSGENRGAVEYDGNKLVLYAAYDENWSRLPKPFLNMEDRRVDGDNKDDGQSGSYRITATMTNDGYVNDGVELKGATTEIKTETHSFADSTTVTNAYKLNPGSAVEVVNASEDRGSHSFSFDQAKLTIPAGLSLVQGKYIAKINWNLMGETP